MHAFIVEKNETRKPSIKGRYAMPLKWEKLWVSDETFESCGVFDVNNDGNLDIVSGAYWYEGPEFRNKHEIGKVQSEGEYHDAFSEIPLDINGDGRMDFICGGWWGGSLRWKENKDGGETWEEHVIADTGSIETTRAWDFDCDGVVEIFPNSPGRREVAIYKLLTDKNGKGTGRFEEHVVYRFPEGQGQGHGHGAGDIAGNGRMDIVLAKGWLECPEDPWKGEWTWHPEFDLGRASNPILVEDVNGDGVNELIVGQAHGYGLDWVEQKADGKGGRTWTKHAIDPFNAQYHDIQWLDIDGDGLPELVTGKRHRAHNGNEAGEWDDMGIYYFKWTGEGFAKNVIDYGPIGMGGKGVGIYFQVADLWHRGCMDLVAPGKDGLYIYKNLGIPHIGE